MEITIVSPVLGSAGGIGRAAEDQAKQLMLRGHRITLIAPTALLDISNHSSMNIRFVRPVFRFGHGAWLPQLVRMLPKQGVVHLHYPFLGGAEAVAVWRVLHPKARLVVTYHMDLVGQGMLRFLFRGYQRFCMPLILRRADAVIASSKDYVAAGDLGKYCPQIIERIKEIPFAVDLDYFKPGEPDRTLQNSLGIQPNDFTVVFVGGMNPAHYFKGVPYLLSAIKILRNRGVPAHLVAVGNGSLIDSFRRDAAALEIADAVHFARGVPTSDLPNYYRLASVSVLASIDRSEAFGLVLLEAQACGLPVVASALPGVRTVFEEGVTGFGTQPKNAVVLADVLEKLYRNPEMRKRMGLAARKRMEIQYNWTRVIGQLEVVYRGFSS